LNRKVHGSLPQTGAGGPIPLRASMTNIIINRGHPSAPTQKKTMTTSNITTNVEPTAVDKHSEHNDCSLAELAAITSRPMSTIQRWLKNGWLIRSGESDDFAETTRVTRASFDALTASGKLRPSRRQEDAPSAVLTEAENIVSESKSALNTSSEQTRPAQAVVAELESKVPRNRNKRKSDYRQAKRVLRRLSLPALLRVGKWIPDRIAYLAPLSQSIIGISKAGDPATSTPIQNETSNSKTSK